MENVKKALTNHGTNSTIEMHGISSINKIYMAEGLAAS